MDAPGNEPSESTTSKDDAKSAVKSVADAALPLEVGSIALGDDGHISRRDPDQPLHFAFTACGVRFDADLADRSAPLRLEANLGKLPYTAESPEGRQLARSVMAATDRLGCGQILLSDQQDMVSESRNGAACAAHSGQRDRDGGPTWLQRSNPTSIFWARLSPFADRRPARISGPSRGQPVVEDEAAQDQAAP